MNLQLIVSAVTSSMTAQYNCIKRRSVCDQNNVWYLFSILIVSAFIQTYTYTYMPNYFPLWQATQVLYVSKKKQTGN